MLHVYRCDRSSGTNHLTDLNDHGDKVNRCLFWHCYRGTSLYNWTTGQARRQTFSEEGSFDTAGGLGVAQGSQKPFSWVFGAKSRNLAISRHFIHTFGKPCFPLLIFKDFHQILHQLGL